MVDLQRLIDSTQLRGLTVKIGYPDAPGFIVEIAWVGKQEMQKIYDASSERQWNSDTRKTEVELDRRKLSKVWADKVLKGWTGLTIERMRRIWPVAVDPNIDINTEIEPTIENRIALLWNSADFEQWVLNVSTKATFFQDAIEEASKNMESIAK